MFGIGPLQVDAFENLLVERVVLVLRGLGGLLASLSQHINEQPDGVGSQPGLFQKQSSQQNALRFRTQPVLVARLLQE